MKASNKIYPAIISREATTASSAVDAEASAIIVNRSRDGVSSTHYAVVLSLPSTCHSGNVFTDAIILALGTAFLFTAIGPIELSVLLKCRENSFLTCASHV